ncbi:FAD-binding oxidoreductase [Arthrobacter sp. 4R501]|uniref:FAD-binding oxidoreductase n=1 Tax=Arthrobacter sp. 4R501 TaxID=2058886 RepID=UPI000CE30C96|nr:FAD-binding oxidoreductase [Arthrobacter sp. 4R501]
MFEGSDRLSEGAVQLHPDLCPDVATFRVERTDERDVKPSLPGQYVTIKMKMPDGVHQPRQYSLTKADDGRHRQFAVKRVRTPGPTERCPNLLHDSVNVGDEVVLSAPFGDVVMEYTDRPVVLASAGIGITPMAGMLSHLAKAGAQRKVLFLHGRLTPHRARSDRNGSQPPRRILAFRGRP